MKVFYFTLVEWLCKNHFKNDEGILSRKVRQVFSLSVTKCYYVLIVVMKLAQ